MNLLETLLKDAETIAESDLPSVTDVQKVLGALLKRVETQAQQDGLALLSGDPDPVIDPAFAVTPISPDGAPPIVLPATVADPEDPAAPVLATSATTDGHTVADHTVTVSPATGDLAADVAGLKSTVDGLVDAVKHLFAPAAPKITTGPVTNTAAATVPAPQHDLAGNPIEPGPDVTVSQPAPS